MPVKGNLKFLVIYGIGRKNAPSYIDFYSKWFVREFIPLDIQSSINNLLI
jgi:hypothetical protein